jgi:hypothetical protein
MTRADFTVGAWVRGEVRSPRALVRHGDLLAAYTDGGMADRGETGEAYLSHFVFDRAMVEHHRTKASVAGFVGACWCRWLHLDIDATDLGVALADARKLVAFLTERYDSAPLVWFSGSKGFHVALDLGDSIAPAGGFYRIAGTFAQGIAALAGVKIDGSVYDLNRILRLPNSRHGKTGLFKRILDADELFGLTAEGIRQLAQHPRGDSLPTLGSTPARLLADWQAAMARALETAATRAVIKAGRSGSPDARAPKYLMDFLRFGVDPGERHATLFRAASWMYEQGSTPSLCHALLTEAALDVGLSPSDVRRQIDCGIAHATRQVLAVGQWPLLHPDVGERLAIQHEDAPLPPDAGDFPFGAIAPEGDEGGIA